MNKTAKILLIVCACLAVTIVALLATKPLWKKDNEPKVDEVVEEEDDGEELEIMLFDDEEDDEKSDEEVVVSDEYIGYSEKNFKTVITGLGLKPVKQSKTYKSDTLNPGSVYMYESTSDGKVFKKGDSVRYWLVDNSSNTSGNNGNNSSGNNGGNTSGGEGQEDTGITDNGDGSYTLPEVPLG